MESAFPLIFTNLLSFASITLDLCEIPSPAWRVLRTLLFDRSREDAQSPVPIVATSLRKSLLDLLIEIALCIVFVVTCLNIC